MVEVILRIKRKKSYPKWESSNEKRPISKGRPESLLHDIT